MSGRARATSRAAAAGAGALLLAACGAAGDPSGPDDDTLGDPAERVAAQGEAIHQGTPAADPAVVALVVRRESCGAPPPIVNCSGTLIAERAILTAAHCVQGPARGAYEVFFGASPGAAGGVYRGIAGRVIDPQYDRQRDDHDVAIVWLDAPAPVAPAPLVAAGVIDPSWAGRTARAVGFGDAGDAATGSGQKLQGTVSLTAVDADTVTYGPAPSMTCNGDSGGPVFVETGGMEALAAVTTSGDRLCEQRGVSVRVDARLDDFIRPALAAGPPSGGATITPDAICTSVCASDADCPGDLVCQADRDGTNRCLLPNIFAGSFGPTCATAADCGEGAGCVPFGDGCRCDRPCTAVGGPSATEDGAGTGETGETTAGAATQARSAGCQASRAGATPRWAIGLVAFVGWAGRRRSLARRLRPRVRTSDR